eukprot:318708_1
MKRKQVDYESDENIDDITPTKKRKINNIQDLSYSSSEESSSNSSTQIININQSINDTTFKHYLPSTISLKTTDESIKSNLLSQKQTNSNVNPNLSFIKVHKNQILTQINNIFTHNECDHIIKQCQKLKSFQNLDNKYNKTIRKSKRLLALDRNLSNTLWNRLKNVIKTDIIKNNNLSTTPLGFDVLNTENEWKISSINIAMRINKYDANDNDFFTFHKDSQYTPSSHERSLFTLIIYLNDQFQGGETNFYFVKQDKNMNNMECTINEEIKYNGGINSGYNCISIKPSIGNGVIFTPNIIHCGAKLSTPNTCKYILKTDVVVKRNTEYKHGFAILSAESIDYQKCLNYFVEAQKNELEGNKDKANELYERSMFIRYLYPNKLLTIKENKQINLAMEVDSIWLIIFDYCHIREMECISYLFGNKLYHLLTAWKLIYNKRISNNNNNNEKYYI